jgi:taurine dehydrogenase small subunit
VVDLDVASVVDAFNDAVNRQDIDAMVALVSPDVVFDGTTPPDGHRLVGRDAVAGFWRALFEESPRAAVETEDMFIAGDRCVVLLRYLFDAERPEAGHVRGVDVLRVQDGLITEKLSYVKG